MLAELDLPVEAFSSFVLDGTAGERIQQALENVEREAIWFTDRATGDGLPS